MRTLPGFLSPGSSNHKAICRKKAARANNVTVFSSAGQGGAVDSNVAQRKLIRASAKTGRKVSARNGTDQNKLRCSRRHEYPLEKRCAKISSTNLKPMYKNVRREKRHTRAGRVRRKKEATRKLVNKAPAWISPIFSAATLILKLVPSSLKKRNPL